MSDNWTSVYTTGIRHLAEFAKQMLEDNNIPAVIMNRKDSVYLFGEIEVFVNTKDKERAKELIEQFQKNINLE